jgi:RHS repeat-associated protein
MTVYSQEGDAPTDYFFHHDGMGSIVNITDANQTLMTTYNYGPFRDFTTTHHNSNIDSPFTYTGREFSSATGIFHYRARSYMPDLGRFTFINPWGNRSG